MSIFNSSSAVAKLVKGGIVVGSVTTVAFGVAKWSGTNDLNDVKEQFNKLHGWYENALYNVGQYKEALTKANIHIKDFQKKDDLLVEEINKYKAQIKDLNQQIEDLKNNGTDKDKETIAKLQEQVTTLQAELDKAVSEEDYNKVENEIARLQNELQAANTEVASLKDYINTEMANTTATTEKVDASTLTGKEDLKLYLTYEWVNGHEGQDTSVDLAAMLSAYNDIDAYRESPIKLAYIGKQTYYKDNLTNVVFLNNTNAINKIATHTNDWEDITSTEVCDGTKLLYNAKTNTILSCIGDTRWTEITGLPSDNGTK